jgi:recombination protein RecA
MGVQSGILEKSGAWFLYKGEKLGQGRENAIDYLKTNPKLANELEGAIRKQYAAAAAKKEADPKIAESAPKAAPAKQVAAPAGKK